MKRGPILVFALTVLAFLPALRAGWAWDDAANLVMNFGYRGLSLRNLRWMFTTTYMGPYQPFSWLSLAFDHALWNLSPAGYHLTSLLLHAANGALFFLIARELLEKMSPGAGERRIEAGALAAALFFSLHPLRAESAAWVTERRDVLSGFFALLATLAYIRKNTGRAFALYAAALLSKGSVLFLPLAWLALDQYPSRTLRSPADWRKAAVKLAPFFALSLAAGVVAIYGQRHAGNLRGLSEHGVQERLAQSVIGLGFYLSKTLWPFDLSPLYELPAHLALASAAVVRALVVLAAAAALLASCGASAPAQEALWVYYGAALLPVSGLLQNGAQLAADRYSYLSCLGWALVFGYGVQSTLKKSKAAAAAAACVLLALAVLSWRRAQAWKDDESLWASAVAAAPSAVVPRLNYGLALAGKRRLEEAIAVYKEGEALVPDNAEFPTHHGWVLLELRDYPGAEALLRRALALSPDHVPALTYLSVALINQRRPAEAVPLLRRAIELEPNSPIVRDDLEAALRASAGRRQFEKTGKK